MSAALSPVFEERPAWPDCSWCGLRQGSNLLYGSPTCNECFAAPRKMRVQRSMERLRRGARKDIP